MIDYDAQTGRHSAPPPEVSDAQRLADEIDLYAGLRGVAALVNGARGVIELLGAVAEFATQAIPDVDGSSVVLLQSHDGAPGAQTWAATAEFVGTIDNVQYRELDEGPCLTCMESRRATVSGSLGSDARWPHFGGRVARMAVHSALSLPLIVGDEVIGAINNYAYSRDAFGAHAVTLGEQFAQPAAVSLYNAQLLASAHERTKQLQRALDTRAVIDQAIGIIRSRAGTTPEEAFDRLTKISQAENIKLAVVAQRIVDEAVRRARSRHQG